MIDKRICLSNKFADLKSDKHRLLYLMIYPHLDVEGRFSSDLRDIKDECVRKLRFSFSMIANALVDLHFVGLLRLYEAKNKLFLEYCKFHEFQKINRKREGRSKIPKRTEDTAAGLLQWCNTTVKEYKINIIKYNELNKEEILKEKEIFFDFKKRKFLNMTIEDKAGWLDAYQACDINQELSKMREWLLANPSKKKKNYRRFITNWLTRTQDKGGSKKSFSGGYMSKRDRDQKEIDDLVSKYPKAKEEK